MAEVWHGLTATEASAWHMQQYSEQLNAQAALESSSRNRVLQGLGCECSPPTDCCKMSSRIKSSSQSQCECLPGVDIQGSSSRCYCFAICYMFDRSAFIQFSRIYRSRPPACSSSFSITRFSDLFGRSVDDRRGTLYHQETPLPPMCCPTAPTTNHMRCGASGHGMAQTRASIPRLNSLSMTQSFKDHRAFALDSFIEASRLSKVYPVPLLWSSHCNLLKI